MNKIAFLYPGQGSQEYGMGRDFYDKSALAQKVYDDANEVLDFDVKKICFEEDERLHQTEYTQPAMVTTSYAMTQVLLSRGICPSMTAGLSLGEYSAIALTGGMRFEDAVKIVRKRGQLMQAAVPLGEGAMCAVIGMDSLEIEEILETIEDVSIANYNCPGQIIITGRKGGVERAVEKLKGAGAKHCLMLNVSGPFHSPMMCSAGGALAGELAKVELLELTIPYVSNVTADVVMNIAEIKELLVRQVSSPVKWMQSMERMLAEGINVFIEIGPGKTLKGLMKKINPQACFFNVSKYEDIDEVVKRIEK